MLNGIIYDTVKKLLIYLQVISSLKLKLKRMYVIALTGQSDRGKSTTLNRVYQLLLENGYRQLENYPTGFTHRVLWENTEHTEKGEDFIDIVERKGFLVGIVSLGDYHKEEDNNVRNLLNELERAGCNVAICALSHGASNKSKEDIIQSQLSAYPHKIIAKTVVTEDIAPNLINRQRAILNEQDAQTILNQVL